MEGIEYAKMLEIPVERVSVEVRKPRLFKRGKKRDIKNEVVQKINDEYAQKEESADTISSDQSENVENFLTELKSENNDKKLSNKAKKSRFKFSIIKAQFAVICVLLVGIFLINAFWAESGINKLILGDKTKTETATVDVYKLETNYNEFALSLPCDEKNMKVVDGVMTFNQKGVVCAPCGGVISSVIKNEDVSEITITHGKNLKTVMQGVDVSYFKENDEVFKSLPMAYSTSGEIKVCFYKGEQLLTDYTVVNGNIVWQV